MKKLGKILGILIVLIILVIAGLSVFVRYYLTEDRLKAMVIPPAEQSLGRQVAIGGIQVGLFKGIAIEDFAIKEEDGEADFVSAKSFVLHYDLLPLLKKQLVVTEVRIENPTILIQRDKNGKFNYETLALLSKSPEQKKAPSPDASSAALPLALTVDQIKVVDAQLKVRDAKGEIPTVDAKADLTVAVDLGTSPSDVLYNGDLKFNAVAELGEVKVNTAGSSKFDREQVALKADVVMDQEKVTLDGLVRNYMKAPDIKLDISSQQLNVDHLAAILAAPPTAAQKKQAASQTQPGLKEPIGKSIPPDLVLHGVISVAKVLYKGLETDNFFCKYRLAEGLFTLKSLNAEVAQGLITSEMEANLMQPDLSYKGNLNIKSLQIAALLSALAPESPADIEGALGTSLNFNGSGTEWEMIKKTLVADGQFSIINSHIRNTEITKAIASLLKLQEINNLTFKDVAGNFRMLNGNVMLNSQMAGSELSAKSQGTVGLDGTLDLPVTMTLSQALTDKLRQRASVAKYLADEQGQTVLNLKLAGTIKKPRPTLDTAAVKQQAEKVIKKKLFDELNKALTGKEGQQQQTQPQDQQQQQQEHPATELLKNLFGK